MDALFKLLRIALGGDADLSVPECVDWPALVALATEQGVAALAHDGLQKCYEADPRLSLPLDRELKAVKYDWFGATLNVEVECDKQWKAVSALGELFSAAGLRTLVLKGFALGECYPVPQHRYSCDFDCFLMGDGPATDRSAFEQGNRAIEAAGVKVRRFHYKHSSFKYEGASVENHQFLTGWRGRARWKRFELELERMLEVPGALRPLEGSSLLVGPPLFNALFLTRHAHQHFLVEEGISLRHVCDWAMFLKRYRQEFDWSEFMSICSRYGLSRFVESMTRLAEYVCGVPASAGSAQRGGAAEPCRLTPADRRMLDDIITIGERSGSADPCRLTPADRRMLDDILTIGKRSGSAGGRLGIALRILRSGWKFRLFSDETRLGCLLRYAWGYFFVKDLKLS